MRWTPSSPFGLFGGVGDSWNDTAGDYVHTKMIDRNHFIIDAPLETVGHIQKLASGFGVIHSSGGEQQRLFWEDHDGRTTVSKNVRKNGIRSEFHEDWVSKLNWVYCGVPRLLQIPSISITDILFVATIHITREIENGLLKSAKILQWIHQGQKR